MPRSIIGRVDSAGHVDTNFNSGANGSIHSILVQPDGKILVGGSYSILAGQAQRSLGRLDLGGNLDPTFTNQTPTSMAILSLVPQEDGKILIGGGFSGLAGQPRLRLARLNADDTVDLGFNPGANDYVQSIAVQPNGKILVVGSFTNLCGQPVQRIGRLNEDGSLDGSFHCEANAEVRTIVLQPDGKLIIGGAFAFVSGEPRNCLARVHPDGSLDTSFTAAANGMVNSIALQTDGRIIIGGAFTVVNGQSRPNLARLGPHGELNPTFNPRAGNFLRTSVVYSVLLQTDGRIIVAGDILSLAGLRRDYVGRLNNTEPATEDLSIRGAKLIWQRGGTSPEVWRTSFALSTNGTDWAELGAGSRTAGGWELDNVAIPVYSIVRARGFVLQGYHNGSSWPVESFLQVTNRAPTVINPSADSGGGSNQFVFDFSGQAGQVVVIEASTNLLDWLPLATNVLGNDLEHFSEPMTLPSRFYRVLGD
jgi:uncharacterized delta-60 repeat protein